MHTALVASYGCYILAQKELEDHRVKLNKSLSEESL